MSKHNLSTKKHNGDLVVNNEFAEDSAAVLSDWLRRVMATLWDGMRLQRTKRRPIWARVS